jgi:hypothetical protein
MIEDPKKKYTHVGVLVETQRKISLLANIQGVYIRDLVETWAEDAWKKAVKRGLVTDAMLDAHWVGEGGKK